MAQFVSCLKRILDLSFCPINFWLEKVHKFSAGFGVPKFCIERQKFANPRAPKNIQRPSAAFSNVPKAIQSARQFAACTPAGYFAWLKNCKATTAEYKLLNNCGNALAKINAPATAKATTWTCSNEIAVKFVSVEFCGASFSPHDADFTISKIPMIN